MNEENKEIEKYFWTWGNTDYNRGYNEGIKRAENIILNKDAEIEHLKNRIKQLQGSRGYNENV